MTSAVRDSRPEQDPLVEIVVADLSAGIEDVGVSEAVLSEDERARADSFVFERDRRRFIMARSLLRRLLAARCGIPPQSVSFVYGAHGKPALANSELCFNVSHCDDLVVVALSHGLEVGIDIEAVRAVDDADRIAARFFGPREVDEYRSLETPDKPIGFFNCWTRKEAFIKACGDGLSHPLDRFEVSLAPGQPARILRVGDTPGSACGWSLESFTPAPGYVAALVTATPTPRQPTGVRL